MVSLAWTPLGGQSRLPMGALLNASTGSYRLQPLSLCTGFGAIRSQHGAMRITRQLPVAPSPFGLQFGTTVGPGLSKKSNVTATQLLPLFTAWPPGGRLPRGQNADVRIECQRRWCHVVQEIRTTYRNFVNKLEGNIEARKR